VTDRQFDFRHRRITVDVMLTVHGWRVDVDFRAPLGDSPDAAAVSYGRLADHEVIDVVEAEVGGRILRHVSGEGG
jgi:hypothetical protein